MVSASIECDWVRSHVIQLLGSGLEDGTGLLGFCSTSYALINPHQLIDIDLTYMVLKSILSCWFQNWYWLIGLLINDEFIIYTTSLAKLLFITIQHLLNISTKFLCHPQ